MKERKSIGHSVALLHRITHVYFAETFVDLNLHGPGQIRMLLELSKYPAGISQEELARELMVDKASISRMIRPLIKNRMIDRSLNPEDRRAYVLTLSGTMTAKLPEIRRRVARWTELQSAGLSEEDIARFFELMDKITANARAAVDK